MELERAQTIAIKVLETLRPFCKMGMVAGSIRRKRPFVHDIDLVVIASDPWGMRAAINGLGQMTMDGPAIKRVSLPEGICADIYFASEETWAALLLIRTGSKEHNVKLCTLAKSKGMKLKADGSGLFRINVQGCEGVEVRAAGDTEASIFAALEIPYKKPEEREKLT